ncbi:histidine kinase 2 [Tanacetum coccineum]
MSSFMSSSRNTSSARCTDTNISTIQDEIKLANLVATVVTTPLRLSVLISCFHETVRVGNKTAVARRPPSTLGTYCVIKEAWWLMILLSIDKSQVAEGALKKFGAIVTCVDSGKAALEKLKPPHAFHACFMDLRMPKMDGFEATRQVRRVESEANEQIKYGEVSMETFENVSHWHTPILAMTADVIQATGEECMKCGMAYSEECMKCGMEWKNNKFEFGRKETIMRESVLCSVEKRRKEKKVIRPKMGGKRREAHYNFQFLCKQVKAHGTTVRSSKGNEQACGAINMEYQAHARVHRSLWRPVELAKHLIRGNVRQWSLAYFWKRCCCLVKELVVLGFIYRGAGADLAYSTDLPNHVIKYKKKGEEKHIGLVWN